MFICLTHASRVAFHIETSHLIYSANQMIDVYMTSNTWLKWVNDLEFDKYRTGILIHFNVFRYSSAIATEYW